MSNIEYVQRMIAAERKFLIFPQCIAITAVILLVMAVFGLPLWTIVLTYFCTPGTITLIVAAGNSRRSKTIRI